MKRRFTVLLAILASVLMMASPAFCQSNMAAPAAGAGPFSTISVSATVTSLSGAGQSTAATVLEGSMPLSPRLGVRVDSVLDSAIDTQGYLGGVNYYLPTPKSVNAQKFQFYVTASVGVDRITPADSPTQQHIAVMAGGGFNYDPTGAGHFALGAEIRFARFPGLGSGNFAVLSFGPSIKW